MSKHICGHEKRKKMNEQAEKFNKKFEELLSDPILMEKADKRFKELLGDPIFNQENVDRITQERIDQIEEMIRDGYLQATNEDDILYELFLKIQIEHKLVEGLEDMLAKALDQQYELDYRYETLLENLEKLIETSRKDLFDDE